MKTISQVLPGEAIKHTGDLVIEGDLGVGSSIDLTDGALTINGNVSKDARIKVQIAEDLRPRNNGSVTMTNMVISYPGSSSSNH